MSTFNVPTDVLITAGLLLLDVDAVGQRLFGWQEGCLPKMGGCRVMDRPIFHIGGSRKQKLMSLRKYNRICVLL